MIREYIQKYIDAAKNNPLRSLGVFCIWVVIAFIIMIIIDMVLRTGLLGFLIAIPLCFFASTKVKFTNSFDARDTTIDTASSTQKPRQSPAGTRLLTQTAEMAVVEIKVAIRFWCWFLPSVFLIVAVVGLPIGAMMGASFGVDGSRINPSILNQALWGAIFAMTIGRSVLRSHVQPSA